MRKGHTCYKFRHYAADGRLLWASGLSGFTPNDVYRGVNDFELIMDQEWSLNALADEGELDMLDVYFKNQAVRASLYFSLWNDTPAETDGLTDLQNEVTGTGYGRITLTRDTDWSEPALDSGDGKTTSVTKTFSAGGTWSDATQLVLSTSSDNSGLFVAWSALSTTRTLQNGETLDVSMGVKLA